MAKKQKTMENKLGSWAEQASFTRGQSPEPSETRAAGGTAHARVGYPVARSLMTRIDEVAASHNMSQQELVGYLLTWSLDQVESGAHAIERE